MKPQSVTMLRALQTAGPSGLNGLDALRELGIYRAGARVYELRKAGYPVTTIRKAGHVATYVLEDK